MTMHVFGRLSKRRKRGLAAVSAAVALAAVAAAGLVTLPAYSATGPTISSWVTTPDMSQKLTPGASVTFGTGTTQSNNITVDPTTTYQTIDGFGASITDSSASLLSQLPQSELDSVMASIFSPTSGIGMSWLRQPLGSSDFTNGPFYTFDDMPAGQTDPTLAHFSIAHDQAQIIPLIRQAMSLNPQLKVIVVPWSSPAWMKDCDCLVGGHMLPQYYQTYAEYLLKAVQAYEAAGVPIWGLSVQNEPQNREPAGYPGTDMPEAAEEAIINDLGPMLQSNGLGNVQIMGYDHNWSEHPNDLASAAALGEDPQTNYAADIMNSSAAQYIAGTAYHCYYGNASAMTTQHNLFPNKQIWMTECSGSHAAGQPLSEYFADTLNWHVQNVLIPSLQNWASGMAWWNLALDSNGNPHNQGCGTCTGVIAIDGTNITYNAEYYIIGHASEFVKPGAVRIGSNNAGDVNTVAFQNPDGSYAMIAGNYGGGTQTFSITFNGNVATETLPPNGLATYTWPGGGSPGPSPSVSPSTSPSASPSTSPSASPSPSSTGSGISSSTWYNVVNTNSGMCVDDTNGSTSNGTGVQQWGCYAGNTNQQWQFQPTDSGYYHVVTRNAPTTGWDVTGGPGATGNGTPIQLWDYVGGTNQQWLPTLQSNGTYTFTARNSGNECLDVTNRSTSDGTQLQQWACTSGDTAQTFQLIPTS